jgi:hypothetical protein
MTLAEKFNALTFSRWINSPSGRAFRLAAGSAFAVAGFRNRANVAGKTALLWSFFPLSAGGLDLCWVSAALGGPLRGGAVRASGARAKLAASVGRVPRGLRTSPSRTELVH